MTLLPAAPDTGILFRRLDVPADQADIAAKYDSVSDLMLCTTICNEQGVKVATVEHLMAAFAGCGVDNVIVELDGAEVPAMDGSSAPFVFLMECADIVEQAKERLYIKVLKEVTVSDGLASATLSPSDMFSVSFEIDFDNPRIGKQNCSFSLRNGTFKSEICRARTFGFLSDFEKMKDAGLAQGGSLDNAIVLSGQKILNEEGLRYGDEFVRHKALDAIGDLYMAGALLVGQFHGVRSGHALNNQLLKVFMEDRDAWCFSTDVPQQKNSIGGANWPAARAAAPATA